MLCWFVGSRQNLLNSDIFADAFFYKNICFQVMQKSVLMEVVQALSPKEIRELNKWLSSPAHNHRQDAVRLFEYLVKKGSTDDKEIVWKAIFPKEPFDDAFLRQVMYFLFKAIEDYFLFKEAKKLPVRNQLSLAGIYRRRRLDKPFRQTIESAKRTLESTPIRDSDHYLDSYMMQLELYAFQAENNPIGELPIQLVSDNLDTMFIANKLRIACWMLAHQSINKKAQYNIGMLDEILRILVNQEHILEDVGIAAYFYVYKALTNRDDVSYFEKLKIILNNNSESFSVAELKELYRLAINYCTSRINTGQEIFFEEAYDLFHKGFGKSILFEVNDTIPKGMFSNAVYAAIKTRHYDWAEDFITRFSENLEDKHRHSTVQFNLSRVYYERGDYNKAQILLREFDYDDMLLNVIAKTMLLKIYYTLGEFDALESLIEAMRSFLQRKEALSPTHKAVFKNTIQLMKKLLHLNPYSKTQVEKFRAAVHETNPMQEQERAWFLQQIDKYK